MDQQSSEIDEGRADVAAESAGSVAATALSRRALLAGAGTLATLGTAVGFSPRAALAARAAEYSAAQVLEVQLGDGAPGELIRGVAGGALLVDRVTGRNDREATRVKVEPVRLSLGSNPLPKLLVDWALASNAPPVELNLIAHRIDRPGRRQLVLANARVSEFAVGPFESGATETLDVEAIVEATGVRHVFSAGSAAPVAPKRPRFVGRSNFRLLVQGFEKALAGVRKVDRISIRRQLDISGRTVTLLPGLVEFELPAMDAAPLALWAEDLASGRPVKPVLGVLQVFDTTGKTLLATIDLIDLTIVKFAAPLGDASGSTLELATVVLQPREIRFNLKGLAA